jgi:hypothetical protein
MFDDEDDIGPRRLKKAKARVAEDDNEPRIKVQERKDKENLRLRLRLRTCLCRTSSGVLVSLTGAKSSVVAVGKSDIDDALEDTAEERVVRTVRV